jgi:plastocyanin
MRRTLLVLVATVGTIALAACGGDDDKSTAPPAQSPGQSPGTTEQGQSDDELPDTFEVTVEEFSFTPDSFEVPQGKPVTVKVTDTGLALHTLTVFRDDAFTDPFPGADVAVAPTQPGEFTATFDEAGTLYFRCGIHPDQMQGEITVQ